MVFAVIHSSWSCSSNKPPGKSRRFWFIWVFLDRLLLPILSSNIHLIPVNQQIKLAERQNYPLFCICKIQKQIQVLYHRTYTNNDLLLQQNSLYLGKRSCFSCEEIQQRGIFTLLSKLCLRRLNQLKLLLSLVRGVKYDRGSKLFSLKLNNSLAHIPSFVNLMTFKGHRSKKKQQKHYVLFWWKDLY